MVFRWNAFWNDVKTRTSRWTFWYIFLNYIRKLWDFRGIYLSDHITVQSSYFSNYIVELCSGSYCRSVVWRNRWAKGSDMNLIRWGVKAVEERSQQIPNQRWLSWKRDVVGFEQLHANVKCFLQIWQFIRHYIVPDWESFRMFWITSMNNDERRWVYSLFTTGVEIFVQGCP